MGKPIGHKHPEGSLCGTLCVDTGLPMNCLRGLHASLMHTSLHTLPIWFCVQVCDYTKLHANPKQCNLQKMFTCLCTSASCNWIGNQNHFGLIEECRLWAPASCRCIPVVVWWTRLEDKGGPTHIQENQTSPTCQPHPGWPSKAKHRSLAASS